MLNELGIDVDSTIQKLKASTDPSQWHAAYADKVAGTERYLQKYSANYASLDFVRRYASDGYYSVQKLITFEDKYLNRTNDYVLQGGWLPLRVYQDQNGRTYNGENPTVIAQAALAAYNAHLNGWEDLSRTRKLCDKLLSMMNSDGSFRYDFAWWYYVSQADLQPGWVSGLAQGQVISALVRAYHCFDQPQYLTAAIKAAEFMLTPVQQGGTAGDLGDLDTAFRGLQTIEEYIVSPNSFTLNGWLYAILGLSDLCDVQSAQQGQVFQQHLAAQLESLQVCLPLYDLDGLSTYDLAYVHLSAPVNFNLGYHQIHIQLLNLFADKFGVSLFKQYADKWQDFFGVEL